MTDFSLFSGSFGTIDDIGGGMQNRKMVDLWLNQGTTIRIVIRQTDTLRTQPPLC